MTHCKILIVDDDPDDREIISSVFLTTGITDFLLVSSARDAITYLQSVQNEERLPKLIITDLNMPGINGNELLQSLKTMQRFQHIPVIVYSTSNIKDEINKSLMQGASEYITKPSAMSGYFEFSKRVKEFVSKN